MSVINPYRDEAIDSLSVKTPAQIGMLGSDKMWGWIGRLYLHKTTRFADLYPDAVLPDLAFDLLIGYVTSGGVDIYRGYLSRKEAVEALVRVRMELG